MGHTYLTYHNTCKIENAMSTNVNATENVLKATGTLPEVVATQKTAAEHGFRSVSEVWHGKTLSYDDARERICLDDAGRNDIDFPRRHLDFHVSDSGTLQIEIGDQAFDMTEHATKQLASWCNVPFAVTEWVNRSPELAELVCDALRENIKVLTSHTETERDRKLKFRTHNGTLRAVLSHGYSTVNNMQVLELLEAAVPGGRVSHFEKSDVDNMRCNILIPDSIRKYDDSDYGSMVAVQNSEVGLHSISTQPGAFRFICMNGCIWNENQGEAYTRRHRGIVWSEESRLIIDNLTQQIPLIDSLMASLYESYKMVAETNIVKIFASLATESAIGRDVASESLSEWNRQGKSRSAFGVIDALTRTSQNYDAKVWRSVDSFASSLTDGRTWSALNRRADRLTREDASKILA